MKLAAALVLAAVTPAMAAYVLYFHVLGRVNGYDAHRASMDRHEGGWADAAQIIGEMVAGQVLVYRVFTDPDGEPHDTEVARADFATALEAYLRLLHAHDILADGP